MTERPTDAFPLKSQVHRGEARDDADRASLDATLKGLGYMAATRPGNADRESALRRVAWQVTNRNYDGLTPGSDLHRRLSEFATAKIIEQRLAASDGSIAAGRAPGEFREATRRERDEAALPKEGGPFGRTPMPPGRHAENWKREQALHQAGGRPAADLHDPMTPALITDLPGGIGAAKPKRPMTLAEAFELAAQQMGDEPRDPLEVYGGYPHGTPQAMIEANRRAAERRADPHSLGLDHLGADQPQAAPNSVRLQILIGTGGLAGTGEHAVTTILDEIERLPELSPQQVAKLVKRIMKFGADNRKHRNLAERLGKVVDDFNKDRALVAPMMSDQQLTDALETAVGRKESAALIASLAGTAARLARDPRVRLPYKKALELVLRGTQVAAKFVSHHFSRREQRYLMEIARRQVERELELKAPRD